MARRWIQRRLDEIGASQADLWRRLGLDSAKVSRIISGERGVQSHEIGPLADFLQLPRGEVVTLLERGSNGAPPAAPSHHPRRGAAPAELRVVGEVQAGHWVEEMGEDGMKEDETIPVLPDSRFPPEMRQYALRVRGASMDQIIADGEYAICVDALSWREWKHGDIAVVIRSRYGGSIRETTLKQIVIEEGELQLWPRSNDPKFRTPVTLRHDEDGRNDEDQQIELRALVIGKYARLG